MKNETLIYYCQPKLVERFGKHISPEEYAEYIEEGVFPSDYKLQVYGSMFLESEVAA